MPSPEAIFGGDSSEVPGTTSVDATSRVGPQRPTDEWRALLAPPRDGNELGWLGNYRILRILGQGGMGVALLAEDPQLHRRVALKVMQPALASDADARSRFLREARATAALKHENVVTIHQVAEQHGVPFFVMELLEGETLQQRLMRAPALSLDEALLIARAIATGLAAAHRRGLIHRDIKPSNIWLEQGTGTADKGTEPMSLATPLPPKPGPRVKILDFGLARPVERQDAELITASGAILGTPAFMAPEQAQGRDVGPQTDLFSLGVVLYRLTTGRPPFAGPNMTAVLLEVIQKVPTAPHLLRTEVPRSLSDLIMRLLAKELSQRPATADEVIDSLTRIELQLSRTPRAARRRSIVLGMALVGSALLAGLAIWAGVLMWRVETPLQVVPEPARAAAPTGGGNDVPTLGFATRIDDDGKALDVAMVIPANTQDVYAVFRPDQPPPAFQVTAPKPQSDAYYAYLEPRTGHTPESLGWRWLRGDTKVDEFSMPVRPGVNRFWLQKFDRHPNGLFRGRLVPGTYVIELLVDRKVVMRGELTAR
jgi:serine/threonine protein kinase